MVDDNHRLFEEGIDTNKPPSIYTKKQDRCKELSIDSVIPISESNMYTKGKSHAVSMVMINQVCKECNGFHKTFVAGIIENIFETQSSMNSRNSRR